MAARQIRYRINGAPFLHASPADVYIDTALLTDKDTLKAFVADCKDLMTEYCNGRLGTYPYAESDDPVDSFMSQVKAGEIRVHSQTNIFGQTNVYLSLNNGTDYLVENDAYSNNIGNTTSSAFKEYTKTDIMKFMYYADEFRDVINENIDRRVSQQNRPGFDFEKYIGEPEKDYSNENINERESNSMSKSASAEFSNVAKDKAENTYEEDTAPYVDPDDPDNVMDNFYGEAIPVTEGDPYIDPDDPDMFVDDLPPAPMDDEYYDVESSTAETVSTPAEPDTTEDYSDYFDFGNEESSPAEADNESKPAPEQPATETQSVSSNIMPIEQVDFKGFGTPILFGEDKMHYIEAPFESFAYRPEEYRSLVLHSTGLLEAYRQGKFDFEYPEGFDPANASYEDLAEALCASCEAKHIRTAQEQDKDEDYLQAYIRADQNNMYQLVIGYTIGDEEVFYAVEDENTVQKYGYMLDDVVRGLTTRSASQYLNDFYEKFDSSKSICVPIETSSNYIPHYEEEVVKKPNEPETIVEKKEIETLQIYIPCTDEYLDFVDEHCDSGMTSEQLVALHNESEENNVRLEVTITASGSIDAVLHVHTLMGDQYYKVDLDPESAKKLMTMVYDSVYKETGATIKEHFANMNRSGEKDKTLDFSNTSNVQSKARSTDKTADEIEF